MTTANNLLPCLARVARLQNAAMDSLALQEAVESIGEVSHPKAQLKSVAQHLHLRPATWLNTPDPALTPALLYSMQDEWGVLRGVNAQCQWITEWWDTQTNQWREVAQESLDGNHVATLLLSRSFSVTNSPVYQLIRDEVFSHKRLLIEAALGGVVVNVVALGTSFYTMQVYDRVVPTGATQTLLVLTLGVLIAIL